MAPRGILSMSVPRPGLFDTGFAEGTPAAYFAVRLSGAVNLLEIGEYAGLARIERLSKALNEQQAFLNGLLDPSMSSAFELRTIVNPGHSPPIDLVLLGRSWAEDAAQAEHAAADLADRVLRSLPRHVTGELVEDSGAVGHALCPFPNPDVIQSVVITKNELVALPSRPDANLAYYFAVVPFAWGESDWTNLYSVLAASPTQLVISVGLLPLRLSESFSEHLYGAARQYGPLAREVEREGGLYFGRQKLPPDPFAVDGERVFLDFAHRYSRRAFVMRIQVSAATAIPPATIDAIADTMSSSNANPSWHERQVSALEVRATRTPRHRTLATWNLRTIDFRLIPGRPDVWERSDPPAQDFQLLCVLGDARDANCAWRFPIALDGTVPGFRVHRGSSGQMEGDETDRQSLSPSQFPDSASQVTRPPPRAGRRPVDSPVGSSGELGDRVSAALPAYSIGAELGRGAFGIVLSAEHRQLHRRVAVKQLSPDLAATPGVLRRFTTEAQVLARLEHPHIVPIYDYVEDNGLCLLVMEFLPGGTVWDRFIAEGLRAETACGIALATSSALHDAHNHGILHRDVKPHNMMFSGAGTVKITDFGIAKVLGGPGTVLTKKGDLLGTPAYMAPEQAAPTHVELTAATDVYGLGASLYELLSGKFPFSHEGGPLAVLYRHVYEQPTPLHDAAPAIPSPIADVVMQALATDPDDRQPTAIDFGIALADAARHAWGPRWLIGTGVEVMAAGRLSVALAEPH